MNREVFLSSQIWLKRLDQNVVEDLKLSFHFHLILSGTFCCFQVENKLIFFNLGESSPTSPKDPTVFKFSIELSTDPKSESAAGLYFIFDDITYLVDHTAIILISFPKISTDAQHPPSVFMEWPGVYLRIWNQDGTPEGVAVQKLYSAVSAMNKVLTASHIHHPKLATIHSNNHLNSNPRDHISILNRHADSWFDILRKADNILYPHLEDFDVNTICSCLSLDVIRSIKIATSLAKSVKNPAKAYDDVAQSLACSILDSDQYSLINQSIQQRHLEVEVRIGGLLNELYPPSTPDACMLTKDNKVSIQSDFITY